MLELLLDALVHTKNEAADDLLLQAMRLGLPHEQQKALIALLKRKTNHGLSGVISLYDSLPETLQETILHNIRLFSHALPECGRSNDPARRMAAMRLIALGRQGKLAYVLSENLHNPDPALSKAAVEAMVALARWVAVETKKLQRGQRSATGADEAAQGVISSQPSIYDQLMIERPEIEAAIARAINLHRGKHGQDLLRAAMLLADWPGSLTLAILHTTKHGGQSQMVRRLQQPPESENAAAFLLGASHGQLRSHFGTVFAHIDQAPVLDAILRKTHWLKDHQLQACLHQVTRGAWFGLSDLRRDVERRGPEEVAEVAEWIAASGLHEVEQDERTRLLHERLRPSSEGDTAAAASARLRLLRRVIRRPIGATVGILPELLADTDERIVRMAAREFVRRKPHDYENLLLKLMPTATPSVRRVIGRAIGQAGFESFWQRFEKLDKTVRRQAGKAMLKLLPDGAQRLHRRALAGPVEQRVKAMQIIQELGVAEPMLQTIIQLCADPNPRVRSKAVTILGDIPAAPSDLLMDKLLNDPDPRVRANTVEVLEGRGDLQFLPVLAQRAQNASNRERANAIRAMHRMKVGTAGNQLLGMLRDERPEHKISALWALRQIGWWRLLNEVGQLAKQDANPGVRRYALDVLKGVAELVKEQKQAAG